jgi:hypothetical protein
MRTTRIVVALVAAVAMVAGLAACSVFGTEGTGDIQTESRTVPAFTRVDVEDGIRAVITHGAVATVEVNAQANILPLVVTQVADGTLRVHAKEGYHTDVPVEVDITIPGIEAVFLSGGAHADVTVGDVDALQMDLSGGSNATATGTASSLTLQASGGSQADLGMLRAVGVGLDLSGGSNATVSATGKASGTASGGSHVTVLGGGTIDVDASGGSSVTPG